MVAPASDIPSDMPGKSGRRGARQADPAFFLPNFCDAPTILITVLIAELVAIIFAIARQALHGDFWIDLAACSLFLLWLGMICSAVLCRVRPWLSTLPASHAAT